MLLRCRSMAVPMTQDPPHHERLNRCGVCVRHIRHGDGDSNNCSEKEGHTQAVYPMIKTRFCLNIDDILNNIPLSVALLV